MCSIIIKLRSYFYFQHANCTITTSNCCIFSCIFSAKVLFIPDIDTAELDPNIGSIDTISIILPTTQEWGREKQQNDGMDIILITCQFREFLGPIPRKFMVGAVGHFTLQSVARTNHKFPCYGGPGNSKGSEINNMLSLATVDFTCMKNL